MKKLLLALLFVSFCISLCYAEVYLVIDKTTKEIITIGQKNDNVLQANQELVILPGDFETYPLDDNPTNYKYQNKKFIKNISKIEVQVLKNQKQEEINAEKKMIDDKIQKMAIDELKKEGKIFKWMDK